MVGLKNVVLIVFGICFATGSYSQNDSVDSLKVLLKSSTDSKTKINLLHKIVWEEALTNPKSGIKYAQQSLQISEKINDSTLIARSYNRIGLVHDYTGNFDLAQKNYLKALKIKEKCDGKDQTDGILNNLGSIYYYTGQYEKSMDFYLKSLKIREQRTSVSSSEKLKSIAQSYNNIGLLLKSQSNYTEALSYYYKGLKIKEELNDYSGLIITLSNIGVIQMQQNSLAAAEESFKQAIHLSDSLGDLVSQAMLFNNMGLMFTREKNGEKAKLNYLQAIEIYETIGDDHGKATALVNLASVELDLNNHIAARFAGLEALHYARKHRAPEVELSALQVLSNVEENRNPQLALKYLNEYIVLKDSVQDVLISNKVNQLAVMYDTERKETEIEILKQEQDLIKQENKTKDLTISRNRIITSFLIAGIVILLILTYVLILYFRSKKKAADEQANKLHEQLQRELDNLRNTLERHLESPEKQKMTLKIDQTELNRYLLNPLTDRELDVLYLIADGLTNKEIGEKLFISVNTVKTHVLRIYQRLDVQNRTAATVKASSLQIIQ